MSMTIKQLQKIFPKATLESWHQHANGGGWIQNTAHVDDKARVYDNAMVYGNAQVHGDAIVYGNAQVYGNAMVHGDAMVYDNAMVYGNAQVHGDAMVYGNAQVYGNARVSDYARVYDNAMVFGDAWVSGDARVYGNARVSGDTWEQSPFFVNGTSWSVTSCSWDKLQIGCKCYTVEEWLKDGSEIGRRNGFTDAQVAEYLAIVRLWDEIRHIRGLVHVVTDEGETI